MIRLLDFILALVGLIVTSPFMVLVLIVGYMDTGSPLFRQVRIGRNKLEFTLVKFRTMRVGTPSVASHEVNVNEITKIGAFLRKTKLDELPQLWNVLLGDMSLVGPRPGLPSQQELVVARESHGVYQARPGITGLAQISNVDMSTPMKLAKLDQQMLESLDINHYFKYIFATLKGGGQGDAVKKN